MRQELLARLRPGEDPVRFAAVRTEHEIAIKTAEDLQHGQDP
jgi:hypothetical protein